MIINCPKCNTKYKLKDEGITLSQKKFRCNKCGFIFVHTFVIDSKESEDLPVILVAHDDYRVVNVIKKVLSPIKCKLETAFDGNEAYKIILSKKPSVAIIDVALQGLFGFELCEKVKNDSQLKSVKIILVASIYDRTRYKRRPQNLYGADDYIEKHHIPDGLYEKVMALLPAEKKPVVETEKVLVSKEIPERSELKDNRDILLEKTKKILEERDEIKKHEDSLLKSIPEVEQRAKKLARLIISDIALYNQDIIDKVTVHDYQEKLKLDFEDAIKYLSQRIPEAKNDAKRYIEEAFLELLAKRKE